MKNSRKKKMIRKERETYKLQKGKVYKPCEWRKHQGKEWKHQSVKPCITLKG